MARFILVSPLSRDEITRQLRDNIDSPWKFFGKAPVVGTVGTTSFRLAKRINYRNSFQTHLFGRLTRENNTIRIHCRTGLHPFVIVFMTVWFGILLLVALPAAYAIATRQLLTPETLFLLGMALFGVVLVGFGRWLSRGEVGELVDFLKSTIDTERAD